MKPFLGRWKVNDWFFGSPSGDPRLGYGGNVEIRGFDASAFLFPRGEFPSDEGKSPSFSIRDSYSCGCAPMSVQLLYLQMDPSAGSIARDIVDFPT